MTETTFTLEELSVIEKWGRFFQKSWFWDQDEDDRPLYDKINEILEKEA